MRKNRNSKLRTSISLFFDAVVAALCCAAAALCVYYFRLDFYQTLSRQNEEPVGIITYKYKAVQRRFVDRLLWDRLQRESPVYNGDFIRTEDLSEATVFFSGGGIVDLAENSLIQIFARDSAPQLQVSEGGVSVNARNSDFVISSGGNTVTVDSGGVVSTRTNPEGTLGLWVNEGRAVVSTAEGVHEAQAGSALSLNQDGNVDSAPLTAVLSPRPGARLISRRQSGLSVEFAFKPVNYNNAELTRLEISASRDFEEKILSRELEAHRLVVELPPGLWWWRAYPVKGPQDKAPASAAAGKLAVLYVSPPTLYAPADGQVFVFRANHPPVRYRWSEASDAHAAQYYLLEVADNPDFRQPELRTQIRGSSALSSQAGPGRWYWRVTPGFPAEYEGQPEASEVFSFVMEQRDEFPAPSLTAPAEGSLISIARNREDLWFSWKSSAELESYTLRISENRDLSNPVITAAVKGSYYIYGAQDNALKEGRYYWGVFGTGGAVDSRLSSVWSFTAAPALNAVFPPDNYRVGETLVADIRFAWKGLIPARRMQVSPGPDFSSFAVNEPVQGESHRLDGLSAGTWYWRVTGDGEESPARRLIVAAAAPPPEVAAATVAPPPPPPPPPPRFEPEDNFVFRSDYFRRKPDITFTWPSSAAEGYTFTLRRADGGQILSAPVSANSFTLRDLTILNRGQFIWQVTGGGRTIGENHFTINIPEVRKNQLRDLGTVLSMQRGSDRRLVQQRISWFRDENASRYELIVEKKEESDYREIYRGASQSAYAEIPVERGTYRFKVLIYNLLGQFEHETNWAAFNIILAQ